MARDWGSWFDTWGQPPSQTEIEEIGRTEREIKAALDEHERLSDKRIRVFGKGSHVRGTNVRRGSDVDIAVELRGDERTGDSWITKRAFHAKDMSNEDLGLVSINLGYDVAQLKTDVYDALVARFGLSAVTRHNKCIEVGEGATTLPVDVVPCRTTRRYDNRGVFHEGVLIRTDKGVEIVNWPTQDADNTTAKNSNTSTRFKRAVRGIKALENDMADSGLIQPVPSFMLECAVYNVPNAQFSSPANYANCLSALRVMASALSDGSYDDWLETNELKYLFRSQTSWTIADMTRFVTSAVDYLGTN